MFRALDGAVPAAAAAGLVAVCTLGATGQAARAQSLVAANSQAALLWQPSSSSVVAAAMPQPKESEALPQAPSAVAAAGGILRTPGGTIVPRATAGPLPLSLDDAIAFGMKDNVQLEQLRIQNRQVRGEILTVENALLPSLKAQAQTNTQEINLAALGFKPSSLAAFGFAPGSIATIVKVNTTSAQLSVDQALFDLPAYFLWRAAQKAADASSLNVLNGRGSVTLAIGTAYLRALADASQITDATALLRSDEAVLHQAVLSHDAGVAPNLDVLRARVEFQQQQQAVIQAENNFAKDKISLNRLMGLPAEQELTLTDTLPFAELAEMPHAEAMELAFARRKDLLALEAEVKVAEGERRAARAERYPTLGFNGYYGVLGETTGLYHGVFTAQGTVKIPIFKEAQFRGEREVADAQLTNLRQQIDALKVTIDEQIRAAMLDVGSSAELVKVAASNVALAGEELDQTTQRFAAGVDDSLPVVRAQATLADAQTRLISATFQNNQAKLNLARNLGVVETQYRSFLGR
jgi:outer membrane protein TolC